MNNKLSSQGMKCIKRELKIPKKYRNQAHVGLAITDTLKIGKIKSSCDIKRCVPRLYGLENRLWKNKGCFYIGGFVITISTLCMLVFIVYVGVDVLISFKEFDTVRNLVVVVGIITTLFYVLSKMDKVMDNIKRKHLYAKALDLKM